MAKQFIDATLNAEKTAMSKQDGTALALTGSVRILYDDALTKSELVILIDRIKNRINELEAQ